MGLVARHAEHRYTFAKTLKKIAVTAAVAMALTSGAWFSTAHKVAAGGETRTVSLYHVHTGESLTVTYKVNGRYIPSALEKINRLMRDWRRDEVITIDPKTIDLMWELHADLGSTRPIHIICGYRSPKTNAFLKRIGRNVARKSQHMLGKAIDLYFPDVPTEKIRNSALVRQIGGVGYYRSAGGPTGFIHIDSGHVRHWGPYISPSQMARIFRDYRRTIGARLSHQDQVMVASANSSRAKPSVQPVAADEAADDEPTPAAAPNFTAPLPRAKPSTAPLVDLAQGYPVPKPRPKPIEVLMMAAANMQIEPASAPAPRVNFAEKPKPVADSLGVVAAAESMAEEPPPEPTINSGAKGSFADSLRDGTATGTPLIKPLIASASDEETFWWPKRLVFSPDNAVRRDGAPQLFANGEPQPVSDLATLAERAAAPEPVVVKADTQPIVISSLISTTSGKGDRLDVNRAAKGSLLGGEVPMPKVRGFSSIGEFLSSGDEQ
jgi:uncharacterized protein YcbK (DUF882 family)